MMTSFGAESVGVASPVQLALLSLAANETTESDGNASQGLDAPAVNKSVYHRWVLNTETEAYVVPMIFIIIFVTGLVGNGTLIVSVLANKVMHNIPNILIVSLSMGDFLLILVAVPFAGTVFTFLHWPFGQIVCSMVEFTQTLSLGVSVFTLCALSADRYFAIVHPMAKMTGRTKRTTVVTAVGIWIVSALFAIPDAVLSSILTVDEDGKIYTFCVSCPKEIYHIYPKIYTAVRLVVYLILPTIIITCFYIMMARVLIRSNELVPVETKAAHSNHQRQMNARKKVAKVVLSFVIIFVVCWLPRHVYLMWHFLDPIAFNDFWLGFKIFSFCLMFINSCVNPFALYFLSGQFRKYYKRYLFCLCRRKRYTAFEPTSTMHQLHSTTGRRNSNTGMSVVNTTC